MRRASSWGLVIGLSALACGRSDPLGPDAGVVAREPVEGCTSVGAFDRVLLRSATRAPAGCVVVELVNSYEAAPADLQLPAGWTLERATWRPTSCDAGWQAGVVTASTVTGRLVLLPTATASATSSDLELLLRFAPANAPAQVELSGVGTLLTRNGCS